jgi:hypothetical protein
MRSDSMTPNPPATPIRVDKGRCKSILRFSRPNLIVSQHTRRFNWLESQLSLVLSPAPMSLTGRHKYQSRLHVERSVSKNCASPSFTKASHPEISSRTNLGISGWSYVRFRVMPMSVNVLVALDSKSQETLSRIRLLSSMPSILIRRCEVSVSW